MRQAKEEEQADIEEFDENNIDKGDDTVRYANFISSTKNLFRNEINQHSMI